LDLDDWHLVFVSVCLVLILVACIPVVMAFLPSREEPFLVLALLGEEGMAEHYYPDDDPWIEVGEEVHWTVYLYNHMGETKYVAVRVKLLNSTILAPNSTLCVPSPAPMVYEVRQVIMHNQTWLFPFSWSILKLERVGDFLDIRSFSANGDSIDMHAVALYGYNYRIVLELWVYDEGLKDFRFGWRYGDELRCAWNQVWFNATTVAL
jgi:hypothetical protein